MDRGRPHEKSDMGGGCSSIVDSVSQSNRNGGVEGVLHVTLRFDREHGDISEGYRCTVVVVDRQSGTDSVATLTNSFYKLNDNVLTGTVEIPPDFGHPGAVMVSMDEGGVGEETPRLYFSSVEIKDNRPGFRSITLVPCHSWIRKGQANRSFFAGTYTPNKTPKGIIDIQKNELNEQRGNGTGERKPGDRVYDYDVYNDLGQRLDGEMRTILGASKEHPYPRRLRTGRPVDEQGNESRPEFPAAFWVPDDEEFVSAKDKDILTSPFVVRMKAILGLVANPPVESFVSLKDIDGLYEGKTGELIETLLPPELLNFPIPEVWQDREAALTSDQEFGRQRIAGINPCVIEGIAELPPNCAFSDERIDPSFLGSKTLTQRLKEPGRVFLVDYHEPFYTMGPKINTQQGRFQYATRCLLFLDEQQNLMPVAIELSVQNEESKVYTPKHPKWVWMAAKAHFLAADSAVHQLGSHWLRSHCVVEPFIIGTHRNFIPTHPIFRLLVPHFKDTLAINAKARSVLISASGIVEQTFTAGKHAMEVCSELYKAKWRFKSEGLPEDLVRRNMARRKGKDKIELVLVDYPYANDGLLIWGALEKWVATYLCIYYKDAGDVKEDSALHSWWNEVKGEGHCDLSLVASEESIWPRLETVQDLTLILTTIIWMTSGHHAAVNFGQYAHGGYMPNQPTMARTRMPEDDGSEQALLDQLPPPLATVMTITTLELLSSHTSDEQYLGQDFESWLVDPPAISAFRRLQHDMGEVEKKIKENNTSSKYPSRCGPNGFPYTWLLPLSGPGRTNQGIPKSVSI